MAEYIKKETALEIVKRTSGDYAAAFAEIAHLPAADVAEVRHGRWCRTEDGDWECFECKETVVICDSGKDRTYRKPFCPNCGALMKEDEHGTSLE